MRQLRKIAVPITKIDDGEDKKRCKKKQQK